MPASPVQGGSQRRLVGLIAALVFVLVAAVLAAPTDLFSTLAKGPRQTATPEQTPQNAGGTNGGQPPVGPDATVVVVLPGETPQPTPAFRPMSELETTYDRAVVWIGLRDGSVRRIEVRRPGTQVDPDAGDDIKPAGITPVVTMTSYGADNLVNLEMRQSPDKTWSWETTPYVGQNQDYELGHLRVSLNGDTQVIVQVTEGILVTEDDYRADKLPTH